MIQGLFNKRISRRLAEMWAVKNTSRELSFYADTKGMTLLAFGRENHDLMIQVMGTSFCENQRGIPSRNTI